MIMPLSDSDHVLGPEEAAVVLIQYGNYSDEVCRSSQALLSRVLDRWTGQIRFVYRHFVHSRVDRTGHTAAMAAEAASLQGKFWEMHRLLMGLNADPSPARIVELARGADLDVAVLLRQLSEGRFDAKIRQDLHSGAINGVVAVPTYFVNDMRLEGRSLLEAVAEALDQQHTA